MPPLSEADNATENQGYFYATLAYVIWGVAPIYFVYLHFAEPLEILAQRIVWSVPLLAVLILVGRQWRGIRELSGKAYLALAACSLLLSINWLTFIYGILEGRINETSLGYFINPLVSIALGAIVLGERLRPLQWLAVSFAIAGVGYELVILGTLPWVAVTLAMTFGLYGLIRKQVQVPAALGLGIETVLLAPVAAGYLVLGLNVERSGEELTWLAFGGVVTVVPLVLFGAAAVRLPLTILGVFQYLAPTISLIIAVVMFNETVGQPRWVAFTMTWVGIAIFTVASWRATRAVTRT